MRRARREESQTRRATGPPNVPKIPQFPWNSNVNLDGGMAAEYHWGMRIGELIGAEDRVAHVAEL